MQEQTNEKSCENEKPVATKASESANSAAACEPCSSLSASSELSSVPPRTTSRINTKNGDKLLDKSKTTKASLLPSDLSSSSELLCAPARAPSTIANTTGDKLLDKSRTKAPLSPSDLSSSSELLYAPARAPSTITTTTGDKLLDKSRTKAPLSPSELSSSSELLSAPARAPSTITNTTGDKLLDKSRTKAPSSPSTILRVKQESFDTPPEDTDVTNISPGAFSINEQKSPPVIEETLDPKNIIENHETHAVVAEVVPDEEEMVAEIKKRLEKEIKAEVAMRFMAEGTEGQTPVVAEVVTTTASTPQNNPWRAWGCILVVLILIIVGTVVGVVVTRPQDTVVVTTTQEDNNNTVCLGATPIEKGQTAISSWLQQTTQADGSVYSSVCTAGYGLQSGTIKWFYLVGTGDAYAVSTCSSDLSFDSTVSVATGSCNKLQCVSFSDPYLEVDEESCPESDNDAATVLFRTDVGIPYYIGVESTAYAPLDGQSRLNFTLSIATIVNAPLNSDCSNSIVIKPGENLVPGTITNATLGINFNETCAGTASVWYSFVGTGDVIDVSTCTSDLNFNSALSVATGSCDKLECISSVYVNYECPEAEYGSARVSFRSEVGVEYFIQVYSSDSNTFTGDFTLELSTFSEGPANEDCFSASMIELETNDTISVVGSMVNAYWDPNINASCVDYGTQSVWYSLIGTGDVYAISTCSSVLNFDSSLSVMTGTCDSLECLIPGYGIDYSCPEASYKAGRTLLRTDIGVEYAIAVLATEYTLDGNFSLNVSIFEPLPNEECSGAMDIQASNGTVYGTTLDALGALNASTTVSFGVALGPDLWYRIVGNGTRTVASLCGETDLVDSSFDPYIQIFGGDGESCDRTLIAENDDFCGLASEVRWFAERGVTYYIRVTGLGGSAGPFGLTLRYP